MDLDKVPGVVVTVEVRAEYHGFRSFLKDIFNGRIPLPSQAPKILNQAGFMRNIAFNVEENKKTFQIHLVKCEHTDDALEFLKTGATTHLKSKNAEYKYCKAEDEMVSGREKFHSIRAHRDLDRSNDSSDDISVSSSSSQVSSLSRVVATLSKELREAKLKISQMSAEFTKIKKEKKEMKVLLAKKEKELVKKNLMLAKKEKELAKKDLMLAKKEKEIQDIHLQSLKKEIENLKERQNNKL